MELLRKCNLLWNTAVGKIFSGFHAIQSLFCWAVQSGEKAEPITGRQHVGPFGGVAPYLRWQMMYDGKGTGFLIPLGLGNRDQAPSFALTFRKMQVNLLPWMSSKLISGCRFPHTSLLPSVCLSLDSWASVGRPRNPRMIQSAFLQNALYSCLISSPGVIGVPKDVP